MVTYDGLGRIWNRRALNSVVAVNDIDTIIWRDSLGRRIREVQTIGGIASTTVDVGWQGSERMIAEIYPSGPGGSPRRVNRTYDRLDRLVSVVEDSTSAVITEIEYIGGRVAWMEYGNGTTLDKTDGTSTTIGHGYDTNRRHLLHEWKDSSTVITSTRTRTTRRTAGRRKHLPGSPAPQDVYTFDSAYRMVGFDRDGASAASTRELDGAGKMTSYVDEGTTITPMIDTDVGEEGLNQYSEFVGARTYNDNGDLVLAPGRKYEYDVAGRLFASNDTSGGGSTTIAKYCHDGMNRRAAKLLFSGGSLTKVIRYAYNGWRVVEEQEAASMTALEVARQYVDGSGFDDHFQMVAYTGSGTSVAIDETYYYHCNSQGFVGALTDDSATRVETYEYKWLGEPRSTSSVGNPYLWQGRYYDDEIEWYYFRNRYYEPRTGEFVTTDPSGTWRHGQGNGYSAFGGNEWGQWDTLGLIPGGGPVTVNTPVSTREVDGRAQEETTFSFEFETDGDGEIVEIDLEIDETITVPLKGDEVALASFRAHEYMHVLLIRRCIDFCARDEGLDPDTLEKCAIRCTVKWGHEGIGEECADAAQFSVFFVLDRSGLFPHKGAGRGAGRGR